MESRCARLILPQHLALIKRGVFHKQVAVAMWDSTVGSSSTEATSGSCLPRRSRCCCHVSGIDNPPGRFEDYHYVYPDERIIDTARSSFLAIPSQCRNKREEALLYGPEQLNRRDSCTHYGSESSTKYASCDTTTTPFATHFTVLPKRDTRTSHGRF